VLAKELGMRNPGATDSLTPEQRRVYDARMAEINDRWPAATVREFVDHIDYAVKRIGADHVGIASDFNGGGGITGWNNAAETANVTLELVRRSYSDEDITKILGGNLLRVMEAVEARASLGRARKFYDAIAKPLGLATAEISPQSFVLGRSKEQPIPYLWIGTLRPSYWAEGSRPGLNQTHIAFVAPSKAAVDKFHRVALASGGRDNGKPGPRQGTGQYYGAFVLDPDGNNIEACVRGAAAQ
jgi:catechol 2,3-dioxygenase-like lactoylglutathione lyase family enzyme